MSMGVTQRWMGSGTDYVMRAIGCFVLAAIFITITLATFISSQRHEAFLRTLDGQVEGRIIIMQRIPRPDRNYNDYYYVVRFYHENERFHFSRETFMGGVPEVNRTYNALDQLIDFGPRTIWFNTEDPQGTAVDHMRDGMSINNIIMWVIFSVLALVSIAAGIRYLIHRRHFMASHAEFEH